MECHSHSTRISDGRSWTTHPQQSHWRSLHGFLLPWLCTTVMKHIGRSSIQSLCDHTKWHFWKRTSTRRWRIWECKQEFKYSYSSQKSTTDIPCFHQWNMSFDPSTPLTTDKQHSEYSSQRFWSHILVHHCLVFTTSDDENPVRTNDQHSWHRSPLQGRAESPSQLQHHKLHYQTSIPSTDDPFLDARAEEEEESFPTAPLDDDIWLEDPVPDRHVCIMSSHNHITSVPILAHTALTCHIQLQKMHQHHTTRWWTSMTSQISKMTTTSDEDIPDLEDIYRFWTWTMVWLNFYIPWTLCKLTNEDCIMSMPIIMHSAC